ncbi:actin [Trichonephila inaurata madagascariensis]|uniref:Actin n=1 Tax=Trichonephila inaurata madagascariensis TaxID=2747483 RepID=A0A8X6YAJ8_9ARAC|nr:actin [Trichonephila inaurata madagascariensis]
MERTKTSSASYSSQRVDNESKTNSFPSSKFSFSTEARYSSKISINSFECTSSSNDTNILDGSRTLDANEELLEARNEELLEARNEELKPDENVDTTPFIFSLGCARGEAIVESLYFLPGPELPEVTPSEANFKKDFFVMSRGAFCKYSEGNYTLELRHPYVIISQETDVLMSIFLKYADFSDDGNILTLDNKLGRCLYIRCSTREELLELKQELQKHRSKCYALERIHLVHYPLKCHRNVVIIDLGSCSTRAGILMDQPTLPFLFFPSVCAIHKVTGNRVYGKEALQNDIRQNSNLSFPLRPSVQILQHSIDVDLVGGLFKKIFRDLNVNPTEYTIQVCLPRSLSTNTQNALVKLLLEDFEVKSVSLTHQALLTLYAHNVSTGIVVDIGDRMDILPVVDGFIVEKGVTRVPQGGQRLIHHMKHALAEKHISLSNDMDSFVVRFISENLSYIPEDYENETKIAPDLVRKSVVLENFRRDDNLIQAAVLEEARFQVPEGFFHPSLWGLDNAGIHQLVQKAIQATGVDVRKKIAENIYVSGGVTTIPGFVERLLKELSILNTPRIVPKVIASKYQYHCSYIGGCEFAQMEVFPKMCVNAKEYNKEQLSCLKKFVLCF